MATAFFSHYLGNWKKPCGKFEKTFFLLIFGERLIFAENWRLLARRFFFGVGRLKNLFGEPPFYREHLRLVSLVLGLEHSCPRPREGLSSRSQSLAPDFFVSLATKVSSTPSLLMRGFYAAPKLISVFCNRYFAPILAQDFVIMV